ncbi:putative ATP-grasp-modified RiPP [Amycolatopsis sp. NPDC059090]|uniref:putative ATP-grasp-modified RiPP n=1 Tax=unclassified Amycolatopsis TaxID=2618356 RepID=UPI003672DFC4
MSITSDIAEPDPAANPLASAALRYLIHQPVFADQTGPAGTRPFGLARAIPVDAPARREFRYCPEKQVAVDGQDRPLVETLGKDWKTKSSTDGDEGPEENWGWEES